MYQKDDIVIKQDSYIKHIIIVKSGIFKCSRYHEDGIEFVQEFFGCGEILGEIEFLLENTKSKTIAEITSLTDAIVYKIDIPYFEKLILENKEFNGLLLRELANKIRYKALRHSFIQTHTLEQNLIELKSNFPELLTMVDKNDLASYLGITLRSLNRSIKKL